MDRDATVARLERFVKTPSLTGEEATLAETVESEMEEAGLETQKIGGNVIGKWEGDAEGKTIILCGHMDTVPAGDLSQWHHDPFGAEVEGDRLFGRGACDMKGGLSAMIGAVSALKKAAIDIRGNITLIATIYEEPGEEKLIERKGIIDLLDRKAVAGDVTIITEPTDLVVGLGHKGTCITSIMLHGVSAHSSVPHLGINAIDKAAKVVLALDEMPVRDDPLLGKGTWTVNRINGGDKINVLPEYCKIEIDRRLTLGESEETARRDFQRVLDQLRKDDKDFRAELSFPYVDGPILIDPEHPIVKSLAGGVSRVSGKTAKREAMTYGTDGAWIYHRAKIPVAIFGPGNIERAHKPDEFVELDQVYDAAKVYALAAADFLNPRSIRVQ